MKCVCFIGALEGAEGVKHVDASAQSGGQEVLLGRRLFDAVLPLVPSSFDCKNVVFLCGVQFVKPAESSLCHVVLRRPFYKVTELCFLPFQEILKIEMGWQLFKFSFFSGCES